MGLSPKLTPSEQGAQVGEYWEKLPEPRPSLSLELVLENQKDVVFFNLGPHLRACGPKTSNWSTASGCNSARAVPGRNCITAMF